MSLLFDLLHYLRDFLAALVASIIAWFAFLPQERPEESNEDHIVTIAPALKVASEMPSEMAKEETSVTPCDDLPGTTEEHEGQSDIDKDFVTATSNLTTDVISSLTEAMASVMTRDDTPTGERAEDPCPGEGTTDHHQDEAPAMGPGPERDVGSADYLVEQDDEFYCEYDSTWETSRSHSQWSGISRPFHSKFGRFRSAARDMQNYRRDYPEKARYRHRKLGMDHMPNLDFYLGKKSSSPDGNYIDEYHSEWFQNYYKLESGHTFIQWLFPLQEPGLNYEAKELTKKEITAFLGSQTAKANLLKSYKLMLDFYGIQLVNADTGELCRAPNWQKRFSNLNRNTHNNQRITRILKCLGTLGFSHYQAPLVHFFLQEILVNGELSAVKESALNYFMFAVLDKETRRGLIRFAFEHYTPRGEFVWCPRKIQMAWSREEDLPQS